MKKKIGLGELGLLLSTISLAVGFWCYIEVRDFGSRIAIKLFGAASSIWINLTIVRGSISEEKERHWEKVSSLTYSTILTFLCPNDLRCSVVYADKLEYNE